MVDKKIILSIMVCLLLVNLVSAADWDNVKSDLPITKGQALTIGDKQVAYNDIWETYKPIEITNALGLGETLFKGAITSHTQKCASNCESIVTLELKNKGVLIQDIKFNRLSNEVWSEYSFDKFKLYVADKEEEVLQDVFETQCHEVTDPKNGTKTEVCENVKVGTKTIYNPIWQEINVNEEVDAGTYVLKITGDKKAYQVIDWQIKTNGIWLEEWAVWYETNLSSGLIAYYKLDETTGTSLNNSVGNMSLNLTLGTNSIVGATGKIGTAVSSNNLFAPILNASASQIPSSVWKGDFSLGFWFKSGDLGGTTRAIFYAGTVNGVYCRNNNGQIRCGLWTGATEYALDTTGLNTNTWYYFTYTRNESYGVKLFINGVENDTQAGVNDPSTGTAGSGFTTFGYADVSATYGNMTFDEIAIWNRTLTANEVISLYNSGDGLAYSTLAPNFSVTLNSPSNGNISNNPTQTFNCSATPPSETTLTDISLFTNYTGTWGLTDRHANPMAQYKLNDNADTSLVIETNGNYNGTFYNGANNYTSENSVAGKINTALSFDGVSYVGNASATSYDYSNDAEFSICAWIKPNTISVARQFIFGGRNSDISTNRLQCMLVNANLRCSVYNGAYEYKGSVNVVADSWQHICYIKNSTTGKIYLNTVVSSGASATDTSNPNQGLGIGASSSGASKFNGSIDDVRIYNVALTQSEIEVIYNEGSGTEDIYNLTEAQTFEIDNLPQNSTIWNCQATNSDDDTAFATSNYTIKIDTIAPVITITGGNGTNNLGVLNQNHTINFTASDSNLDKCWYNSIDSFYENCKDTYPALEGYWRDGNPSTSGCGSGVDIYYLINFSSNVNSPINITTNSDYFVGGNMNKTAFINTSVCSLPYKIRLGSQLGSSGIWCVKDGIYSLIKDGMFSGGLYEVYLNNVSINNTLKQLISCSSGTNSQFNSTIQQFSDNINFYANDTSGNTASQLVEWDFKVIENNRTYTTTVSEQSSQTFRLNTTLNPSHLSNAYATLIYNGTSYSTTKSTSGSNTLFTNQLTIPLVTTNTNVSFYWIINSTSGDSAVTNTSNQTIINILIDDCSVYTTRLYNFSIKDEQNKTGYPTYNGTLKLDLSLSTLGTTNNFLTYNRSYNSTDQKVVCVNINLTDNFRIDLIGEYNLVDHVTEFYYVDNGTISNATIPINKDLFSLLTTDSTTFLFAFEDASTIPVADAIVHVFRYYIDEAKFYEVETAKTDDNGQTHVHLVEEDVIYMFMIDKNSVWIYNSSNYNAKCISTPCQIELSATADLSPDIPASLGNSFTVSSDENARTVTLDFELDEAEAITFGLYKFDKGTAILLTNETITTAIGSITLDVPSTYGNSTHFVAIFENDVHVKSQFIPFEDARARATFGTLGVILGALIVLTVVLMAISEGVLLVFFIILAVLLIVLIRLFEMSWLAIASIIIVGGVIVFKLVSRGRKQT